MVIRNDPVTVKHTKWIFTDVGKVMMAFILATDFDFIAYMSKMAFFFGSFFHANGVFGMWFQWFLLFCMIYCITVTCHCNTVKLGGRNSSVGSAWARCPQHCRFDPPLGTFSGRGDFSLGVNMGSNSIPQKTLSGESINRGLFCAHMHFIARTQKILMFMSWTGECRQQKHAQHAPSTKMECDYLNGWIKKRSHMQKSHPKVVNPRDIAGERKNKTKQNC